MNNFLAIDTSSRYLTVLAVKGEKKVLKYLDDCAMKHSVKLMGVIDAALKEAELSPAECDFFAAVTGPGSFTGIRIGISAAKGFAAGADKPLLAITSFDLLAYNVKDENFYTVIDAAHGHYYACGYGNGGEVVSPPAYVSAEEVGAFGKPLYGFEALPFENYTRLDAGACLYAAARLNAHKVSDTLNALYVRKSQAEEGRR